MVSSLSAGCAGGLRHTLGVRLLAGVERAVSASRRRRSRSRTADRRKRRGGARPGRRSRCRPRTDSAGARNFLTDALGSTLALADSTGTTQTSYTFEPFGNTTVTGATTTNSFAFTGRELDSTGLYFYRARYYNPTLQRFISEDPSRFRGDSPNFYLYVLNNPISRKDPFGLYTFQLGLNVSGTLFGGTGSLFAGIVIDTQGNVAVYNGYGVGLGEGAGAAGGVSFAVSNAYNVCGIGGPFAQASGTGGFSGAAATADYFTGAGDAPNGIVDGAGATIGIGGGAAASAQFTNTFVHPFAGRKQSCPK